MRNRKKRMDDIRESVKRGDISPFEAALRMTSLARSPMEDYGLNDLGDPSALDGLNRTVIECTTFEVIQHGDSNSNSTDDPSTEPRPPLAESTEETVDRDASGDGA